MGSGMFSRLRRNVPFGALLPTLLLFGLCAALSNTAFAEPRVALVIGNSAYETGPLRNPINDARIMAATLRDLGFDVIERLDVDQKAMKRAVGDFGDRLEVAGKAAVGLFYYAGHGVQTEGINYMIPVKADIERERDVDIEAVSANAVLRTMAFAGNRVNIVVMDACRNNPYARSFRSSVRGLARMDAAQGTLIAYATSPGNVAADGDGANSPYTAALVEALRTPGLTVEKMFKAARNRVVAMTDGRQVPWESSSLTGADLYLAAAPAAAPATAAAPAAPAMVGLTPEMMFWQSIQDSKMPSDYEAYLQQFPNGTFAALARSRLAAPKPVAPSLTEPAVGVYPSTGRKPGDTFRDCPACPEVVVVPAGSFRMGDLQGGGVGVEKPVHTVTIGQPFAVGKYEVTFSEWDACVSAGGCNGYRPDDKGWGRGNRPVIYVSWKDAQQYVAWLSRKTGKRYRLPSEAEWEYAARAGTTTKYFWGNGVGRNNANCDGCGSEWDARETALVGSFGANAFGLHDMHGNVWEWVKDCWNNSYAGAPSDGSVWTSGECSRRIRRGGSGGSEPRNVGSADRSRDATGRRDNSSGFRIVRTLN